MRYTSTSPGVVWQLPSHWLDGETGTGTWRQTMRLKKVSDMTYRDVDTGKYYMMWGRDGDTILMAPLVAVEETTLETVD